VYTYSNEHLSVFCNAFNTRERIQWKVHRGFRMSLGFPISGPFSSAFKAVTFHKIA